MCKELDEQLEKGSEAARACVNHLHAMGAARCSIPITVDGKDYIVTVAQKETQS